MVLETVLLTDTYLFKVKWCDGPGADVNFVFILWAPMVFLDLEAEEGSKDFKKKVDDVPTIKIFVEHVSTVS